jgi:hypothetical protein
MWKKTFEGTMPPKPTPANNTTHAKTSNSVHTKSTSEKLLTTLMVGAVKEIAKDLAAQTVDTLFN